MNKYYPVEPENIHIQSLIHIIQENNRVNITNKGKGKLPLFSANAEQEITIYADSE